MFRLIIICITAIILCGCAGTHYYNYDPSASFEKDSDMCNAYAIGAIAMPMPNNAAQNIQGSGVIGGKLYNFSGTVKPDPFYSGLNNLAAGIGVMAYNQNMFDMCMKNLGWATTDDDAVYQRQKRSYKVCIDTRAWRLVPKHQDPISLARELEAICNERWPGGFIAGYAYEIADIEYKKPENHGEYVPPMNHE